MNFVKGKLPYFICSAILIFLITGVYFYSVKSNGKFIYALDDAYIHMAYVKNIVLHNVWGITRYEFSSSTSSPLWTILLSVLFLMFGVNEFIPLIINIILSFILLFVIFNFLKQHSVSGFFTGVTLFGVIVLLPISIHIFSGMEHLFHSILTVLFIKYSAESLAQQRTSGNSRTKNEKYLFLISVFITTIRYEGFFLVIIVTGLFLLRRKFTVAVVILSLSLLLPVFFSFIFIHNGEYFLPNSIMLKKSLLGVFSIFNSETDLVNYIIDGKKIIFLFILSVVLYFLQIRLKKEFWSEIPLLLFILIAVILIQKSAINFSYFRYDAYLVVAAITIDFLAIYDYCFNKLNLEINFKFIKKYKLISSVLLICLFYFTVKEFCFNKTITATKNIYEQQYQMARFIDKFYSGKEVALNDVGTVNFFADIHCLDLIGLGSDEIANERMNKTFNTFSMYEIAKKKNVKIAIIYDKWVQEDIRIPKEWIKAGNWKIPDNYICGDDEVSFYAVSPDQKKSLEENLKSFSKELPPDVFQSGEFLLRDN